ncbi:MAG: carbohydrate binding domain-containing protein, partial [Candidatus Binatus sp.]
MASSPSITDIPRIGVNLGTWTYYGAEQYRQNVLMNPGFEPTYEGRILEVANPTATTFEDDVNWIGEGPANWYNGATFSVRSGVSTGATGQISGYNPNSGGDPIFTCKGGCPSLNTGDEVSMYYTDPPAAGAIASWWTSDTNLIQTNSDHEPNSQGSYSLQATLNGSGHRLDSFLDSYGGIKTINYLPVTGTWTISFWAKAVNASSDASVSVNLVRLSDGTNGNTNFMSQQNFTPTGSWQQFSYSFTGAETANLGTLDFSVVLSGSSGAILLDDMTLGPASGGPGGWRNELVSTLSALHPGVIRDTQGQLGEPFSQRTGGDTAHGPSSYNGPTAYPNFTYTMADFFALANAVGAEPWVVIPDTVTDAEIQQYGQFLEQQQSLYHFPEIMIELGNEN